MEVLANSVRQEKIGREVKLSLFTDHINVYLCKNLVESTKKLLKLINEFSKLVGYQ